MIFKKKASLELSIRTIVVIILAMTLLGLGLGFIRNTFTDIGGLSGDVSEQIRQQIQDDLITNDKKLSFPKTEVKIDKGKSEILTVGIRNKEDDILTYNIQFTSHSVPDSVDLDEPLSWFQFREDTQQLSSSESDISKIRLNVPKNAKTGSYLLSFDVIKINDDNSTENYATKDLFIVIRG